MDLPSCTPWFHGQNPAPPGGRFIPLFARLYISQVPQDFIYQLCVKKRVNNGGFIKIWGPNSGGLCHLWQTRSSSPLLPLSENVYLFFGVCVYVLCMLDVYVHIVSLY